MLHRVIVQRVASSRPLSPIGLAAAGDLRLIEAVRARNPERVRALLAERVNVNATQGDGATALHWAVHLDDVALVDDADSRRRARRRRRRHRAPRRSISRA